nr:alpha/beta hydrolase [Streptococcus uberis]
MVFNLATLYPIPYLGSVANHYTVPYVRLWLPLLAVVFLVSLFLALRHQKSHWHLVNAAIALISFLCGAYIVLSIETNLNHLGADVSFLKSYQAEENPGVSVDVKSYAKSPYGDLKLNVYYTKNKVKDKPVLIFIHGGGWVAGHRSSHAYYWQSFAKDDYVVFSLDYDLSNRKRHLSDLTEKQLAEGFAWVKKHAKDYGGSTDRLAVTGISAGGNLALELAYKINNGSYKEVGGRPLPKVSAVAASYPVADPQTFYENDDPIKGDTAKAMVLSYFGGRPDQMPEKYAERTPKNAVSTKTPPTLLIAGQRDTLVPQEATYHLSEVLTKHGISNKLVIIPFTNHAFDRVDGNLGSQAYLHLTKAWFKEQLQKP